MYRNCVPLVCALLLTACGARSAMDVGTGTDTVAHRALQGLWVNNDTQMPVLRISGDTITYMSSNRSSLTFAVVADSLYTMGHDTLAYKIEKRTALEFWVRTSSDGVLRMHKYDEAEDYLLDTFAEAAPDPIVQERLQKDSVVTYNQVRYRGYVFINPTTRKVVRSTIDENGLGVESVYFDNVIHICVYKGSEKLYGRDIEKGAFAGMLSRDQLDDMVLADMDFEGVDAAGYHYRAVLKVPDSYVSYYAHLTISLQGDLEILPEAGASDNLF